MSNRFWKLMDGFFLLLIEATGEEDILPDKIKRDFARQRNS